MPFAGGGSIPKFGCIVKNVSVAITIDVLWVAVKAARLSQFTCRLFLAHP
jgi:hypothetical protein